MSSTAGFIRTSTRCTAVSAPPPPLLTPTAPTAAAKPPLKPCAAAIYAANTIIHPPTHWAATRHEAHELPGVTYQSGWRAPRAAAVLHCARGRAKRGGRARRMSASAFRGCRRPGPSPRPEGACSPASAMSIAAGRIHAKMADVALICHSGYRHHRHRFPSRRPAPPKPLARLRSPLPPIPKPPPTPRPPQSTSKWSPLQLPPRPPSIEATPAATNAPPRTLPPPTFPTLPFPPLYSPPHTPPPLHPTPAAATAGLPLARRDLHSPRRWRRQRRIPSPPSK